MEKKCIVKRNSDGIIDIVLVKNPNIDILSSKIENEINNTRTNPELKFNKQYIIKGVTIDPNEEYIIRGISKSSIDKITNTTLIDIDKKIDSFMNLNNVTVSDNYDDIDFLKTRVKELNKSENNNFSNHISKHKYKLEKLKVKGIDLIKYLSENTLQFNILDLEKNRYDQHINNEVLKEVQNRLMQTGLVKKINTVTNDELVNYLKSKTADYVSKQVVAFHGSPHSFDRFTTDKMGTGEGAQAFGWGLYFTDLEGIARNYAKVLSNNKKGSVYLFDGIKPNKEIQTIIAYSERMGIDISKDSILQVLNDTLKDYEVELKNTENKALVKRYKTYITQTKKSIDFINNTQSIATEKNRNLYKVTLHKGKSPSEYTWLEWDKPFNQNKTFLIIQDEQNLSEESKFELSRIRLKESNEIGQKQALRQVINDYKALLKTKDGESYGYGNIMTPEIRSRFDVTIKELQNILNYKGEFLNLKGKTGSSIYQELTKKLGSDKEASLFLLDLGIDGIKYPAESISRGATSDTARGFNYVVFDENAITVEEYLKFQKTLDLAIGGFYDRSTKEIYLNKDNSNILETSIHEFGHAYLDWLKDYYPDHLIAGKTLLDINKTEAQSYINYVKETQPDLDENSDEFKEEVLAQIIGDNGSKLINSKSNNDIIQWLNDLWEMFKNIIGLTDYTAQDIVNMSLQDFANAVNSDMINNNISKYSISILESFDFKNLKGKQVKKETIKQYLNKQGIKQIEKDIINSVLDQKDFDNKFNYDVFEKAVKLQIMPLSKIDSDFYSDYGADNINLEYDKSKTIVYNTPVNHNINEGYHFTHEHELYKQANTENTEIKIISSDKHFGPVTLLLDKNGVELYRKEGDYSLSAMRAYYGNQYATTKELTQGGFGHTRVWLKDDAYIIAEIQSDIFQKNNIKNDLKGNDLNTKQFIASSKFFELRLIRESIKDAATKGYDKVRIPLPFTLSTIEGYLNNKGQYTVTNDNDIDKEYLEQGDLINYLGETYIIIYSNNNEIKALPYEEAVTSIYTSDDIEQMLRDNGLYDEWYNASTSEKKDIINSMFGDNIVIEDKLTGDFQEVNESGAQTFPQWRKGKNNIATDRLSFRISDLEEFRQPVARRYEKLGDLLKQERGDDNFNIIEDENGYPWYETKIKDTDRNESIKAFQIVPEHILNMKYDDELTNSLNTAIEMKNEEEATDQQIKNETGWEYNKITGVWEYEINNGQFIQEEFYKLQDNSLGKNKTSETDLKNIWEHPELYEIFPDLKKAKIIFTDINNIDVNINIGTINENDIDNLITNIEKLSMKSLSDDEYFRLKDLLKSKKGTRLSEEQEQYLENTLDSNLRYVIYDILKGHSLTSAVARLIQRNIYEGNMIISKDNILNIVNKELPLLLKEGIFRKNVKITEANAMLSYIDNNPIFKINKNIGIDLANKEMTHEIQHYIQDFFDEGLGGNQYEYPLADIKRRMLEIVDIKIAKSNNSDDIKYLQKKKKEYEKTDPRILRKIYYNNLIGEVQSRMAANRYDYDYEDRKILFSNNIDVNSLDIIDKYIHDNSFIPSQLYENLKNEPFMGEEEALEIYKPMVYSKEASYINSINLNEC